MFELIRELILVDYWIVKHMTSRKNTSGNKFDVGWQYDIDIDKNSRKVQCKSIIKKLSVEVFFV